MWQYMWVIQFTTFASLCLAFCFYPSKWHVFKILDKLDYMKWSFNFNIFVQVVKSYGEVMFGF